MRLTAAALALGATIASVANAQDDDNALIDLDLALNLLGIDVSAAVDIFCYPNDEITLPPAGTVTTTATETTTKYPVSDYNFLFLPLRFSSCEDLYMQYLLT